MATALGAKLKFTVFMSKIAFRVSARTARLIGRENIASPKGAIIELVKNTYDADSPICIVYFDNRYAVLPDKINEQEYIFIKNQNIKMHRFEQIYQKKSNSFEIKEKIDKDSKMFLKQELNKLNALYIIDAGEGMTRQIIENHWMIIGTEHKTVDVFTKNRRIKAGAKGIGRFALDKLGNAAEMLTIFAQKTNNKEISGYQWKVKWSDFEGDFKTIDSVNADLFEIKNKEYNELLCNSVNNPKIDKLVKKYGFNNGTMLKITDLRDNWDDFFVNQIYSDLKVLIPPKENKNFAIFLFSSLEQNKYGKIVSSICDDYDYKLTAKMDQNQKVRISIFRNEYDLKLIPPAFFNRDAFKKYPYRKDDFQKKEWTVTKTLAQLLPGFKALDHEKVFNNIGAFAFTFYFMKKTYHSKDAKKFFYRKFMAHERKKWLEQFGGIKLFRDNFRVRPYAEIKEPTFDWLALGARKTYSPIGVAKKGGGYKVNPNNIAGGIKISRLTNINFEDKSSREGLQENKTFLIFKEIIAKIIAVFEDDRAYIAREMSAFYDEQYPKLEDMKKIELLEEIEKLKDEQKILRGLASSGIVMASFTHELSNLDHVLDSRIDDLKIMISKKIKEDVYVDSPNYLNPFILLKEMRRQDTKVQNWLKFSIGTAKKDKRTRKKTSLRRYFENFKTTWKTVLDSREIAFDFQIASKDIEMYIFEIDLDSIFNNLLVNSIDSFLRAKKIIKRSVSIDIHHDEKAISMDYKDNGPGISIDITEPDKIFDALYTTKRNQYTGEEVGTGLGMWLVKTISEDNDAAVKLLSPDNGFGIRFIFPVKYRR